MPYEGCCNNCDAIATERCDELEIENKALREAYDTLLDDVRGACGCTDGDDIRNHLQEYLTT